MLAGQPTLPRRPSNVRLSPPPRNRAHHSTAPSLHCARHFAAPALCASLRLPGCQCSARNRLCTVRVSPPAPGLYSIRFRTWHRARHSAAPSLHCARHFAAPALCASLCRPGCQCSARHRARQSAGPGPLFNSLPRLEPCVPFRSLVLAPSLQFICLV